MKWMILILALLTLAGCAGKKLMKDCEHKGSGIYECNEL